MAQFSWFCCAATKKKTAQKKCLRSLHLSEARKKENMQVCAHDQTLHAKKILHAHEKKIYFEVTGQGAGRPCCLQSGSKQKNK
jgi:hypothetical protein